MTHFSFFAFVAFPHKDFHGKHDCCCDFSEQRNAFSLFAFCNNNMQYRYATEICNKAMRYGNAIQVRNTDMQDSNPIEICNIDTQ